MKFGIELEFTAATVHAQSQKDGRFFEYVRGLLEESAIRKWRVAEDASCGNELVSPILQGDKGMAQVHQVCACVEKAKEVFELGRLLGPDAGVHFHYDANDLIAQSKKNVRPIRNVMVLSAILEPLWYSMNPGARFDTAFAAPLNFNLFQMCRARDMIDIRDIWFVPYMGVNGHSDSYRVKHSSYSPIFINNETKKPEKYDWTRYHGMNLVALFKHGTIEFRYTHGTFDPELIEKWFEHYKAIVHAARELNTRPIMRACPMNIEAIKANSIQGLQKLIYGDLRLALDFLFNPHGKRNIQPILAKDPKMLHFILERLVKYNPKCVPATVIHQILEDDGTDFHRLWDMVRKMPMSSAHHNRNRYAFTPKSHIVPNNGPSHNNDYPEDDEVSYN